MPHASQGDVRVRRLMVSSDLDLAIQRFIADLRLESGTAVDFSTVTRVLWAIALSSRDELSQAARMRSIESRPKNGDAARKLLYEEQWLQAVRTGLRDALGPPEAVLGEQAVE